MEVVREGVFLVESGLGLVFPIIVSVQTAALHYHADVHYPVFKQYVRDAVRL
ncbi:hypothetical protein ES703_20977 [subsurface metagenome]